VQYNSSNFTSNLRPDSTTKLRCDVNPIELMSKHAFTSSVKVLFYYLPIGSSNK